MIYLLTFCLFTEIEVSPFVRVLNEDRHNHSGVVIENGEKIKILTCSHMLMLSGIKSCQVDFYIKDQTYISLPAKILKYDHNLDLMLLEVDNIGLNIKPVLLGLDYGTIQTVKGYSGWNPLKTKLLNHTGQFHNNGEIAVFNGVGLSGMSGSPIMNKNGEIVAIQSTKGDDTVCGCSIKYIRQFLLK